ncbi:MAG: ATP-binding protein [Eubacteriales bacterium]
MFGNLKIKSLEKPLIDTLITVGTFIVSTGFCFALECLDVEDLNYIIIYVLGILFTAVFTNGTLYSSVLSVVSVLGYNFFFAEPKFAFRLSDRMYIFTFMLMFAVGITVSLITSELKHKMARINELDIEKEKLKSEAEREKLKATLLRSISHDLRTPLTTIKNGAELIVENPDMDKRDRDEILGDISSKSMWMIGLVENLLSLTRIDSEKLTVKKSPEALEEIIPQAVRNVCGIVGNRKIHYDMPDDLLLIPMDATLIIQTVSNILTNAIRHTKDDGNIWIKVWSTGSDAVFRFTNDGEPISEKDLPHIFEMYYTSGDRNGVGIGLAICELIVTAHGGKIEARNTEDKKVSFEFNLPMEENTDG